MSVVIDASVALALALPDEHSDWAQRLLATALQTPARAPALWEYEVISGLRNAERRGRMSRADADLSLHTLLRLPVRLEQPRWTHVMTLSRQLSVSTYDASYLEVASRLGMALITTDRALSVAATDLGVVVVGT